MTRSHLLALRLVFMILAVVATVESRVQQVGQFPVDCDPAQLQKQDAEQCRVARHLEGRRLFEEETFGGNGRTCLTCHSRETGTFSPADVQSRLLANPAEPLFRHDGLDDGVAGTTRIEQHATVRITLPLPAHLTIVGNPSATHVTFNRGTPSTKNTPALDPVLMYDLRAADLKAQALGAIEGHAQHRIAPTDLELELIAEFQRNSPQFFSDGRLKKFAETGIPPSLPEGITQSEQRGRLFFIDAPFQPPSTVGVCALCHAGAMLNRTNRFANPVFGGPTGANMHNVGVSEANFIGNPVVPFLVHDGLGEPVAVSTSDIGVLMTSNLSAPPIAIPPPFILQRLGLRLAFFANFFKTPTLWGVKDTAPYFHDNSAKDLDDVLKQYDWFFLNHPAIAGRIELSAQDREDIKAFLKLL